MNCKKVYFTTLVLLILIPHHIIFGQDRNERLLVRIRDSISMAFDREESCISLFNEYNAIPNPGILLQGYIGGLHIARSKHASRITDKNSFLKKGATMLEEAIKKNPGNLELLFLRLTIQLNLPAITGYKKNIQSDKEFVLDNFKKAGPELQKNIRHFVLNSGFFTGDEQVKIAQ